MACVHGHSNPNLEAVENAHSSKAELSVLLVGIGENVLWQVNAAKQFPQQNIWMEQLIVVKCLMVNVFVPVVIVNRVAFCLLLACRTIDMCCQSLLIDSVLFTKLRSHSPQVRPWWCHTSNTSPWSSARLLLVHSQAFHACTLWLRNNCVTFPADKRARMCIIWSP